MNTKRLSALIEANARNKANAIALYGPIPESNLAATAEPGAVIAHAGYVPRKTGPGMQPGASEADFYAMFDAILAAPPAVTNQFNRMAEDIYRRDKPASAAAPSGAHGGSVSQQIWADWHSRGARK